MKTDELVSIFIEKFKLNSFKIVGMDTYDIMWSSKIDNYGITLNIISKDIEFFNFGHKIGFISNDSLERGIYDIDPMVYDDIVSEMIESLQSNKEIQEHLNQMMTKYITAENYEDVISIKNFLKLIY
jgi:hypothetical protein